MRPTVSPQDFFALRETPDEAIRFLIRFAALAPSSHNTQPWLFAIRENTIEVYANLKRALPGSDGNHRELYVSVGCALQNLLCAADWYGLPVTLALFPDANDPTLVARVRIDRLAPEHTELSSDHPGAFMLSRHNNRSAFDASISVPGDFLEAVRQLEPFEAHVAFLLNHEARAAAKIACDATEEAFHDKNFTAELSEWIRPSLQKYEDGMPGYNLGIPWFLSFIVPFVIRYGNSAKQQRKMVEEMLRTTQVFAVIHTENDEPGDWVAAGRKLERMWLEAERRGIRLGVIAAPIEIGSHYRSLQEFLKTNDRPQVFFRLGYAKQVPKQSPRLSLESVMVQ